MKKFNEKERANFIAECNEMYSNKGVDPKRLVKDDQTYNVGGGGGMQPLEEKTLTGKVVPIVTTINGNAVGYVACECTDNTYISLKRLMMVSNLSGYHGIYNEAIKDEFIQEFSPKNDENTKSSEVIRPTLNGKVPTKIWTPWTRELYEFAAWAKKTSFFKDVKVKYLGTVVRQFIAKRRNDSLGDIVVLPGYKRIIVTPLYELTGAPDQETWEGPKKNGN